MKTLKNILFWISTVCLAALIILIAVPRLAGVDFRAVVTGSMEPDIPVGALVVIFPAKAENIKIGDDITFVKQGDIVVTHRVVDIDRENNLFTTWGIANDPDALDAPCKYENIIGAVKLSIPIAGWVFSWLSTLSGKILIFTTIIVIYLFTAIINMWNKGNESRRNQEDILENTG